jgi:hypothetical protein
MVDTVPFETAVGVSGLRNPDSDNGLWPEAIPLTQFRQLEDGMPLTAAAITDEGMGLFWHNDEPSYLFGTTAGDDEFPVNDAFVEWAVPQNYIAGEDITLIINAKYVVLSGTPVNAGSHIRPHFYRMSKEGVSTLVEHLPLTGVVTTTSTDFSFVVEGDTLAPGDRVQIQIEAHNYNSGAGTLRVQVNSVRIT